MNDTEPDVLTVVKWVSYSEASEMPENYIGGMGGFFQKGMRWKDYLDAFTDQAHPDLENLRKAIIEGKKKFNGAYHQHSEDETCPVFSDGSAATFSYRAWGDLMAAVWSTEENTDYSYMSFYC